MYRTHRRDKAIKDEGHNSLCSYNLIIINLIYNAIGDTNIKSLKNVAIFGILSIAKFLSRESYLVKRIEVNSQNSGVRIRKKSILDSI